jgi:hypothetical protein
VPDLGRAVRSLAVEVLVMSDPAWMSEKVGRERSRLEVISADTDQLGDDDLSRLFRWAVLAALRPELSGPLRRFLGALAREADSVLRWREQAHAVMAAQLDDDLEADDGPGR